MRLTLLPPLVALLLLSNIARAWMAEWIYPLDKSLFRRPPAYGNPLDEIQHLRAARRFVPEAPPYAYRAIQLYHRAVSRGLLDASSRKLAVAQVMRDFEKVIGNRPVFPEYLARFALFLQAAEKAETGLITSFTGRDPSLVSEEKVEQALLLGYQDHNIRAFAALYYQYRGERQRALELWRSILTEDPSQTGDVLKRCFHYYQNYSFLVEIIPQGRLAALLRFQESLLSFRPQGRDEKLYLKTLPWLIEWSQRGKEETLLFEMIGRTYRETGEYSQAYFWYQKAFQSAKTPFARASLLVDGVDLLLRLKRLVEAHELVKRHLGLSSLKPEILARYADTSWRLGEREGAIDAMRELVRQKDSRPPWRDQLASFLYEEGRYREAIYEWRTLLHETRGTDYETANKDRLHQRLLECEQLAS